jgi:PIN domain nuclease of toxin-antitoxin system
LLDTHLLLWAAGDLPQLSSGMRDLLAKPEHDFMFSAASIWEVVIKRGLGRDDFQIDPNRFRRGLLGNGYEELPISSEHTLAVAALPPVHRDPFDRILIAQASVEGITLLTSDTTLASYGAPVKLV